MNKKLLIGIIVVIVVMVVFLMVAMTRGIISAVESAIFFWIPLAVWIFLVWKVWKKKTKIFHDQIQMEPKLAERRLKRLKTCLLVGGMSFAMFWLNILVGNVIFDKDPASYFIAWFSALLFVIATIGGLYIFLKGQEKQHKGIPK